MNRRYRCRGCRRRLRTLAASSVTAASLLSPTARAFDRFWQAFVSGNFKDATKWLGGAVPGNGDNAVFRVFGGTPAPYTITLVGQSPILGPASYVNDELRVGPNTVTLAQSTSPALTSSTYTLNSAIQIGEGTGATIVNTSVSSLSGPNASIGFLAGSAATLNVNAGSFNVTGSGSGSGLFVGDAAPGTLNINANTQVNVTGSGSSSELTVGNNATGTLNVNANAVLNVTGNEGSTVIAANPGVGGTVNVRGAGATWNNTSGSSSASLVVGGQGTGALNITAGGQVNDQFAEIGFIAGSVGTVLVTGADSAWTNRGDLTIGASGNGTLAISGGAQVSADSAFIGTGSTGLGQVSVSGSNSLWSQNADLTIGGLASLNGVSGSGTLNVSAGGQVITAGNAFVGSVGTATATITGAGSKWMIASQLNVDMQCVVSATSGGAVTANSALDSGAIIVSGPNSSLTVSDFLNVSNGVPFSTNLATMTVSAGGHVGDRVAFLGVAGFSGVGQVNLTDVGSTWNTAEQLYVGLIGGGTVSLTGGAQVTAGETQLAVNARSNGVVTIDGAGSTFNNAGNFTVGVAGTATLTVSNGGTLNSGPVSIGPLGTVQGNSVINASVHNGGKVLPGVSAIGTLQINGDYTQTAGGDVLFEVGSTTQFDKLQVGGNANLDGTIQTSLVGGFTLTAGDRFKVLTSTHRSGVFGPSASFGGGGPRLVPIYTPTDVVLLAVGTFEKTWAIDADGNSSPDANWIGLAPVPSPAGIDDRVAFTTAITAPRTVTVDAPFTAGSIYFDGANAYTLQGPGAITLDASTGSVSLAVKNLHGVATHTIAVPVTFNQNASIDVAANGTLKLTQQMTTAAGVTVTRTGAGTLAVKNIRADALHLSSGTTAVMPAGGAAGTSLLKSLFIGAFARLDLNNNDLLIDYPPGLSPYQTIRTYLLNGLNTGNGGIISTVGQSDGRTIHAIVDNAARLHLTSFDGFSADDSTIIAKYTLRGDATLDGSVGFADLVALAQNFDNNSGQATWDMGDFDYDGNVGFSDLVALAQNYNAALPTEPIPGATPGFKQALVAALASVPEPSAVAGIALVGFASIRRRRRKL